MRYVKLVMVLCASALLVSCSSISKEAKAKLAKPVNCETAKKDMAMLEKEKASVARQAAAGVTSILPVGAALALVTGDTKSPACTRLPLTIWARTRPSLSTATPVTLLTMRLCG